MFGSKAHSDVMLLENHRIYDDCHVQFSKELKWLIGKKKDKNEFISYTHQYILEIIHLSTLSFLHQIAFYHA